MPEESRARIFCLEDDTETIEDFKAVLEDIGFEILAGATEELVKQTDRDPFDLLILDIMIHSGDERRPSEPRRLSYDSVPWQRTGLHLLKLIRDKQYEKFGFPADIPVVVISGAVDEDLLQSVRALGIARHIEKPPLMDDVIEAVKVALAARSTDGG